MSVQLIEGMIGFGFGVAIYGWLGGLLCALILPLAFLTLQLVVAFLMVKPLTASWAWNGRNSAAQHILMSIIGCSLAP